MEDKEIIWQYNNLLVNSINGYVEKSIVASRLLVCKTAVVLCTGVFSKVEEVLKLFAKNNKKTRLIIIARSSFLELIKKEVENPFVFIEWDQKFSVDIMEKLQKEVSVSEIDSLIYLCKEAVDLRDMNVFQIMLQLNVVHYFSFSSGEELNYYREISKLYGGLKCYMDLIDWVNNVIIGSG